MTVATIATAEDAPTAAPRLAHPTATYAELAPLVAQLHAVIDESPHYNAPLKAYEKRRLTVGYLEARRRHRFRPRVRRKASTYVRPDNEVSRLLLLRYGYKQVALLENHIFGLDFILMEKPYTKTVEGYEGGIRLGRIAGARRWMKRLAGL